MSAAGLAGIEPAPLAELDFESNGDCRNLLISLSFQTDARSMCKKLSVRYQRFAAHVWTSAAFPIQFPVHGFHPSDGVAWDYDDPHLNGTSKGELSMWKVATELTPLAYAAVGLITLTSIRLARNAREIWFVLVVAGAVAMALASFRRQRGSLIVRIGTTSTLSFRPKQQR
jgi:hypothetical protein